MTYQAFTGKITQTQEQCTHVHELSTWVRIQQDLSALLEKEPDHTLRFYQEYDLNLWPSQTSTAQAIIAHIFYPHEALEELYQAYGAEEYSMDNWMLTTRLTMTRLAFAATYGSSPVALFYLGQAFHKSAL